MAEYYIGTTTPLIRFLRVNAGPTLVFQRIKPMQEIKPINQLLSPSIGSILWDFIRGASQRPDTWRSELINATSAAISGCLSCGFGISPRFGVRGLIDGSARNFER